MSVLEVPFYPLNNKPVFVVVFFYLSAHPFPVFIEGAVEEFAATVTRDPVFFFSIPKKVLPDQLSRHFFHPRCLFLTWGPYGYALPIPPILALTMIRSNDPDDRRG